MAVQISIEKGDYNIPKLVFTGDAIDLDQTIAVGTIKEYNELMAICEGGGMAKVSLTSDIGGTEHKFRGMAILNTFAANSSPYSFSFIKRLICSNNSSTPKSFRADPKKHGKICLFKINSLISSLFGISPSKKASIRASSLTAISSKNSSLFCS